MILADTSVWIDHLRAKDTMLEHCLETNFIVSHAYVIGEIALGSLGRRQVILEALDGLPRLKRASESEVCAMIERDHLFGLGIGYIDAHLIASVRLTPGTKIWTRDKWLQQAAERLNLSTGEF
jgi:predicted nucleic acid-binding protein